MYIVNCNWVDSRWQQHSTVQIYTQKYIKKSKGKVIPLQAQCGPERG